MQEEMTKILRRSNQTAELNIALLILFARQVDSFICILQYAASLNGYIMIQMLPLS